jgi:hypothetical protein
MNTSIAGNLGIVSGIFTSFCKQVVQPGGPGSFFKREVQVPALPVNEIENSAGFRLDHTLLNVASSGKRFYDLRAFCWEFKVNPSPGWYGETVGLMRGLLFGRHNPCYLIDGQQARVYRKYDGCSFQLGFQVKAL